MQLPCLASAPPETCALDKVSGFRLFLSVDISEAIGLVLFATTGLAALSVMFIFSTAAF